MDRTNIKRHYRSQPEKEKRDWVTCFCLEVFQFFSSLSPDHLCDVVFVSLVRNFLKVSLLAVWRNGLFCKYVPQLVSKLASYPACHSANGYVLVDSLAESRPAVSQPHRHQLDLRQLVEICSAGPPGFPALPPPAASAFLSASSSSVCCFLSVFPIRKMRLLCLHFSQQRLSWKRDKRKQLNIEQTWTRILSGVNQVLKILAMQEKKCLETTIKV